MSAPPTVHSPRSPSGYHRWAHCLDAAHAEAPYPDQTTPWAAEGTLFHTIIAKLLDTSPHVELKASDYLDEERTIDGHVVRCDEDMVRHLEDAKDYIDELPGRLFVEKKVSLERWMPGEWGTTDSGLVNLYAEDERYCPNCKSSMGNCRSGWVCENGHGFGENELSEGRITIVDWKYGAEPVSAERNEQLMLYALGFWNWLTNRFNNYSGVTDFRLVIRQPRVVNGHSSWDCSLDELLDFGKEASEKHKQSQKQGNPRSPGKKTCRWCKAKPSCKAYNDFVLDAIGVKLEDKLSRSTRYFYHPESDCFFTTDDGSRPIGDGLVEEISEKEYRSKVPEKAMTVEPTPARYLTPEQRAHILTNWSMISKWHKQLEIDALNDALKGRPTPGQKVIVGRRGKREWKDKDAARKVLVKLLAEKAIVETIISPTEAENNLTQAEYRKLAADHVTQAEGKPVLVGEDEPGVPFVSYDDKLQQLAVDAGGEE